MPESSMSLHKALHQQLQLAVSDLAQSRANRRQCGVRLNNILSARWPFVVLFFGVAAGLCCWCQQKSSPAVLHQQNAKTADPKHKLASDDKTRPDFNPLTDTEYRRQQPNNLSNGVRWLLTILLTGRSMMQLAGSLLTLVKNTKKSA